MVRRASNIFLFSLIWSMAHVHAQNLLNVANDGSIPLDSFLVKDQTMLDSIAVKQLDEVVITGTKTEKTLQRIPIPIERISSEEIQKEGSVRLNEVLTEQTGLNVVNDIHGQGIQIQGLDPAYTLILIDGQPVIGRTTGIFDLTRITTNDIDRIEVVKGPTSSLYGSEAMAGVINIISKEPENGLSGTFSGRYGTNHTTDLSLGTAYKDERFYVSGFVNRYSSNGYTLGSSLEQTVSPFYSYTLRTQSAYKLDAKTNLKLSVRYSNNHQKDQFLVDKTSYVKGIGKEEDLNIAPMITHRFSDRWSSSVQLYRSTYKTNSDLQYEDSGLEYEKTYFNQALNKIELQNDYALNPGLKLSSGLGTQYETVEATRYTDKKTFASGYAYLQADWLPFKNLNIIGGGRYDVNNIYPSQVSPKLSAGYTPRPNFTVYGSVGRGYKAPDFRQLYLNFSNNISGYSVFGYEEVLEALKRLQESGQIQAILIDPSTLQKLKAESSTAFNLGFRYRIFPNLYWTSNLFRNNVRNLIETQAVAIKTNGQSVFTYLNLNRVYTQGVETDLNYQITKQWKLLGGFQYLEAYDQDVIEQIKARKIFSTDPVTNRTKVVKRKDYGGLLNRSKFSYHTGIGYDNNRINIGSTLRAIYRGRYGYRDIDGNGILTLDQEYAKGYVLVNASLYKSFVRNTFKIQLTAQNLFNYTDPQVIYNLPGRLLYGGISYYIN